MKRVTVALLALAICASLAACGGQNSSSSSVPSSTTESSSSEVSSSVPESSSSAVDSEAPDSSSGQTPVDSTPSEVEASAKGVVDAIENAVGIAMPSEIDDTTLKDVFYIDPADAEEYYGKMSMTNTSADHVLAVKPKADKKDAVKQSLEKRLQDVRSSFEQYLPEQYEKSQKGQVYERGDYLFLLILGESTDTFDADMQKTLDIIDATF